jgi:hypothetical protein
MSKLIDKLYADAPIIELACDIQALEHERDLYKRALTLACDIYELDTEQFYEQASMELRK